MKNLIISGSLAVLLFGACKTSQLTSYSDDVYANPAENKRLAILAAEEKAKKEAEEKQKQEAEVLAQKAKDDANPYYKDPQYNTDDYYDYQYASRVRRFNNPISGAGYYDNYYTNSYWYNQNPTCYGTSIYSTYNWMPSNQFNNYSYGMSYGNNPYCNYGYNNYGYNNYYGNGNCWNTGYNNYNGYNSYNNGYYNGYNQGYYSAYNGYGYNPYNNGNNYFGSGNGWNNGNWGYFNSYDVNSSYSKMSYGVRGSNGGGNSPRNTTAGMKVPDEYQGEQNNIRQQFIESMVQKQEESVRFTEIKRKAPVKEIKSVFGGENTSNGNAVRTPVDNNNINPVNNGTRNTGNSNSNNNPVKSGGIFSGNSSANEPAVKTENSNPVRGNSGKSARITGTQNNGDSDSQSGSSNKSSGSGNSNSGNSNSGWNSSPSNSGSSGNSGNSGGSSSPRGNSGGGGNSRPR